MPPQRGSNKTDCRARIPKPTECPRRFVPSNADGTVARLMRMSQTQQQLNRYCQIVVSRLIAACLRRQYSRLVELFLPWHNTRRMLLSSMISTRTNCVVCAYAPAVQPGQGSLKRLVLFSVRTDVSSRYITKQVQQVHPILIDCYEDAWPVQCIVMRHRERKKDHRTGRHTVCGLAQWTKYMVSILRLEAHIVILD